METSSASKTSTITWITGLSNQAIPATVVSTVLSIFCYVTCFKNNSYLYLNLLLITISLLEHTEPISLLSKSISMNIIITATANNISLKLKQSKFLYTYFFYQRLSSHGPLSQNIVLYTNLHSSTRFQSK